MIDDLTPLHQLSAQVSKSQAFLYKPDKAYRMQQSGRGRVNKKLVGNNHPNGAIINYYISNSQETDTVHIDILQMDNTLIQRFSTAAKEAKNDPTSAKKLKIKSGGNRLVWNMRYPGFKSFDGMVLYSSPNVGPKAVPGKYKVRLTYNGKSQEQEFTIVKDPRLPNSSDDFNNQFDFLIEVRDQVSRANQAMIDIHSIKKDLNYLKEKTKDIKELQDLITNFKTKMEVIENNIHMTKNQSRQDPLNYGIRINNRLAFLLADSQRGDYPPTNQSKEFFKEIKKELDIEINALNNLIEKNITAINEKVISDKIPMISLK